MRHIDVYLQEDQLTCTRLDFPLVSVPMYLPNNYKLEQNDVHCIENSVYAESRETEHEMLVIMNENHHNNSNQSTHSSFSRLHLLKLNDMGFGLNRISPVTFDGDAFQTPENRELKTELPH